MLPTLISAWARFPSRLIYFQLQEFRAAGDPRCWGLALMKSKVPETSSALQNGTRREKYDKDHCRHSAVLLYACEVVLVFYL